MPLSQMINSLGRIVRNPYIGRIPALGRYAAWQGRRIANRFPVELRLSDSVLIARSRSCGVSSLVNTHGLYDYNNMWLIKHLLAGGGGFVDVGANIGAFTLIAAEQATASVLAIEPHPDTFAALANNVQRNGRSNVILTQAAAGEHEGFVRITDTPGSSTTHIVGTGRGIEVRLQRVDQLLARHGIFPNVVKIDVEGFELGVLRGFGAALAQVDALFVEINGLGDVRATSSADISQLLLDSDFEGPLYCDVRARRLCRAPVHDGEDPIFVRASFVDVLNERYGYTVERPAGHQLLPSLAHGCRPAQSHAVSRDFAESSKLNSLLRWTAARE